MEHKIRMDTDEMLQLSSSLAKISDEVDRMVIKLRTVDYYLPGLDAISEELRWERHRMNDLVDSITQISGRVKQTSELFGECEANVRELADTMVHTGRISEYHPL